MSGNGLLNTSWSLKTIGITKEFALSRPSRMRKSIEPNSRKRYTFQQVLDASMFFQDVKSQPDIA